MNSTVNANYTTNPLENKDLANTLQLFASHPPCVGGTTNTSFATEPTIITPRNAGEFFQFDHTPIKFKDGHGIGDHFECATSIPLDIDNSSSDNPAEWVHPDNMETLLKEHGLNYWIVASRNHWRSKEGEAARPRFHVYLPLAAPLHDADKFVLYCLWCIQTLNSDPKVRLKSQKLFGYGDNPKQFFWHGNDGRCIDEVVSDADLTDAETAATIEPEPVVLKTPPPLPSMVAHLADGETRYGGYRDFNGLKQHLIDTGQTFAIAKMFCGLNDGNRPDDPERHQPCPMTDCKSDDDGFYHRPNSDTFHCRTCGHNGDLFDTIAKVHDITPFAAFDMVAAVADSLRAESNRESAPSIPTMPQNTEKDSGNENSGNNENVQNDILYQTEYPYSDERGFQQYKIVRKDFIDANGEPHKEIFPMFWDSDGNTVIKEPATLYPYRLLETLHAEMVFIVEGEKCADWLSITFAVAGCKGIAVTTSQGGAQRWHLWQNFLKRYPTIAEKVIRILPDNDAAGMNYARTIATAILETNPDADVKIVELPGLPDGGDYVDWQDGMIDIGNDDLPTIMETFSQLNKNAAPITLGTVKSWKQPETKSHTSKDPKSKLKYEEWDKMLGTALTASEVLATDWGQLEWIVDSLGSV